MRKLFCLLLSLALLLLSFTPCCAEEAQPVSQYSIIFDDAAGLIDSSREAEVRAAMEAASVYGNILFVTVNDNSYTRVEKKAQDYVMRTFGDRVSCSIFMIDMTTRQLTLQNTGELKRMISSGDSDTIMDNVYRYASAGNYAGCAVKVFSQVESLARGAGIARPMKYISNALIAVLGGVMIMYIVLIAARAGKRKKDLNTLLATVVATGVSTGVTSKLVRTVNLSSSSSGGGHGGGGFSGGGGGGGFSGGSHGF
ncbi:MAG: TPM domain-containing protein [Clostridia bacterium]|nr:TPM domain-containing protein [Clostridia bacterium]